MSAEIVVQVRGLDHTYLPGTPMETVALRGAQLTLQAGQIGALIGDSGAGKSTLLHYLNGLLRPAVPGLVRVFGQDIADASLDLAWLRQQVGLVFQYPQQQLIERYAGDDVAYGPRQLGLGGAELRERVRWAMEAVGLPFESLVDRPSFSLSGGETRRLALAGALALRPRLLVLDEATTGLDPRGKREIQALLRRLREEQGLTLLLVSNDMEEVAALADHVAVMHAGRTLVEGETRAVFGRRELLVAHGLAGPAAAEIVNALSEADMAIERGVLTAAEGEEAIWRAMTR